MSKELIVVEQLPVIVERLESLKGEITTKVTAALALEVTEESVKEVKTVRAELSKEFKDLEERRKGVKNAIMTPYEKFEAVYKDCVSDQYKKADSELKVKIDDVENGLKQQKRDDVIAYYNEYATSKDVLDFAPYQAANINVTLSASLKSLKEQAKAFVDRICDDLLLIETQENKAEILVEYKQSLNVSQAITTVTGRIKAIEEQKQRQAEMEQRKAEQATAVQKVEEVLPPPIQSPLQPPTAEEKTTDADPVITVQFKATAAKSKLRELKLFMESEGIQYE